MIVKDIDEFINELKERMNECLCAAASSDICTTSKSYHNSYLKDKDCLIVRNIRRNKNDIFIDIDERFEAIWIGECNELNNVYKPSKIICYSVWKEETVLMTIAYKVATLLNEINTNSKEENKENENE